MAPIVRALLQPTPTAAEVAALPFSTVEHDDEYYSEDVLLPVGSVEIDQKLFGQDFKYTPDTASIKLPIHKLTPLLNPTKESHAAYMREVLKTYPDSRIIVHEEGVYNRKDGVAFAPFHPTVPEAVRDIGVIGPDVIIDCAPQLFNPIDDPSTGTYRITSANDININPGTTFSRTILINECFVDRQGLTNPFDIHFDNMSIDHRSNLINFDIRIATNTGHRGPFTALFSQYGRVTLNIEGYSISFDIRDSTTDGVSSSFRVTYYDTHDKYSEYETFADNVRATYTDPDTTNDIVNASITLSYINASANLRPTVSWIVPAHDGNSPITGYRIALSEDFGISFQTLDTVNANTLSYTHTSLLRGVFALVYRVFAINTVGESLHAEDSIAFGAPGHIPNLFMTYDEVASARNDQHTFDIAWNTPEGNGSTITGYEGEYSYDEITWVAEFTKDNTIDDNELGLDHFQHDETFGRDIDDEQIVYVRVRATADSLDGDEVYGPWTYIQGVALGQILASAPLSFSLRTNSRRGRTNHYMIFNRTPPTELGQGTLTGYTLRYAKSSSFSGSTYVNYNTTELIEIENLDGNANYYFRLYVRTTLGRSNRSRFLGPIKTGVTPPPPIVVSRPEVTGACQSSFVNRGGFIPIITGVVARVNWSIDNNNGSILEADLQKDDGFGWYDSGTVNITFSNTWVRWRPGEQTPGAARHDDRARIRVRNSAGWSDWGGAIYWDPGTSNYSPACSCTDCTPSSAEDGLLVPLRPPPPDKDKDGQPGPQPRQATDPPSEVQNADVTVPDVGTLRVSYEEPDELHGNPILGYTIEVSTDNIHFAYLDEITDLEYDDDELPANALRYYRITPRTQAGVGPSVTVEGRTNTLPGFPTDFAIESHMQYTNRLSWSDPELDDLGGLDVTGFRIDVSEDNTTFNTLALIAADVHTYDHEDLIPNDVRYYRIYARTEIGISEMFAATSNTVPAGEPIPEGDLTITVQGNSQLDLDWNDAEPNGSPVTGWRIDHSLDGNTFTTIVENHPAADTSYSHNELGAGTINYYRVYAINAIGTSRTFLHANAQTTAPAGTGLDLIERTTVPAIIGLNDIIRALFTSGGDDDWYLRNRGLPIGSVVGDITIVRNFYIDRLSQTSTRFQISFRTSLGFFPPANYFRQTGENDGSGQGVNAQFIIAIQRTVGGNDEVYTRTLLATAADSVGGDFIRWDISDSDWDDIGLNDKINIVYANSYCSRCTYWIY